MKPYAKAAATAALVLMSVLTGAAAINSSESGSASAAQEETAEIKAEYCLKAYDGYIAIYKADGKKPISVTEIEISTLNKEDAKLLKKGIEAENKEAVLMLLEDFGS